MTGTTQEKKEQLAAHLRAAVLTLELPPASDVDEATLCARFGLSRTPLREVFRDLAGEGYFDLHAGRGVRVSELSHVMLRGFFQAAPMVYAAVLQLAAQNASPRQIAELKVAQARFRDALASGSASERALSNIRFHEITGEMADNPYLLPSFQRLLIDHARIGMTFYRPRPSAEPDKLAAASAQHDAIIAAIEARDAEKASQLALDHWQLSRSEIESYVMPKALDASLGAIPEERFA